MQDDIKKALKIHNIDIDKINNAITKKIKKGKINEKLLSIVIQLKNIYYVVNYNCWTSVDKEYENDRYKYMSVNNEENNKSLIHIILCEENNIRATIKNNKKNVYNFQLPKPFDLDNYVFFNLKSLNQGIESKYFNNCYFYNIPFRPNNKNQQPDELDGYVEFSDCIFDLSKDNNLIKHKNVNYKIFFNNCTFYGDIHFDLIKFEEKAYFEGAIFENNVIFDRITFCDFASFKNAVFKQNVKFLRSTSKKNDFITFNGATFEKGFSFVDLFCTNLSFLGIKLDENKKLSQFNQYFDKLPDEYLTNAKDIPEDNHLILYEDYRRSCDIIKNYLDSIGQRIDANKFYALSLLSAEKEFSKDNQNNEKGLPCLNADSLVLKANKWISNHGQSWILPLSWILFIFFVLFCIDPEYAKVFIIPTETSLPKSLICNSYLPIIDKIKDFFSILGVVLLKALFGFLAYQFINALRFNTKR